MEQSLTLRVIYRSRSGARFALRIRATPDTRSGDLARALLARVEGVHTRSAPATAGPGRGAAAAAEPGLTVVCPRSGARRCLEAHAPLAGTHPADAPVCDGDEIAVWQPQRTARSGPAAVAVVPPPAERDCRVSPSRYELPAWQPIEITVTLPAGSTPEKTGFPWLSVLLPVVLGAAVFAVTRSPLSLLFLGLAPLMGTASWWERRRTGRARQRAERAAAEAALSEAHSDIDRAYARCRDAAQRRFPDAAAITAAVRQRSPLLWSQRVHAERRCGVRLGVAAHKTGLTLRVSGGSVSPHPDENTPSAASQRALRERVDGRWSLVTGVDPLRPTPLGIVATPDGQAGVLHRVLATLAACYPPSQVRFVFGLAEPLLAADLAWALWLPHLEKPAHFATTPQCVTELLRLLRDTRDARVRAAGAAHTPGPRTGGPLPHLVCVVAGLGPEDSGRLRALLPGLGEAGISVVWAVTDYRQLPPECDTWVSVSGGETLLHTVDPQRGTETALAVTPEPWLGVAELERFARCVAPLRETVTTHQAAALPERLPLTALELPFTTADIRAEWRRNRGTAQCRSLRVPIGVSADGAAEFDLVADGPHAFVCGTTGSGKSRFFQTWLSALALRYPPEELQLLLVDFKGGAAFADLAKLPHTAGMITDLSADCAQRLLRLLRAEISQREHLFARLRISDLRELEALGELEASDEPESRAALESVGGLESLGDPTEPVDPRKLLPRLLVVIDEFSFLIERVPEFLDGIIDIAQRGRSLGVHVVLAAQQPGAIRTPGVSANIGARIVFRTASEAHSIDVINDRAAAQLSRRHPGRALLKIGEDPAELIHTAFPGHPAKSATLRIDSLLPVGQDPSAEPQAVLEAFGENLVAEIRAAAAAEGYTPARAVWQPPLPERLTRDTLGPASPDRLPLGTADQPDRQRHRDCVWDLAADAHLLVCGIGGSGKTTTLCTAIAGMLESPEARVWVLAENPQAFAAFAANPDRCEIVDGHDPAAVALLRERIDRLRTAPDRHRRQGRTLVVCDDYTTVRNGLDLREQHAWDTALTALAAKGPQERVHLALAVDRPTAAGPGIARNIPRQIHLGPPSDPLNPVAVHGSWPAGRGIVWPENEEVQIAETTEFAIHADPAPPAPPAKPSQTERTPHDQPQPE